MLTVMDVGFVRDWYAERILCFKSTVVAIIVIRSIACWCACTYGREKGWVGGEGVRT